MSWNTFLVFATACGGIYSIVKVLKRDKPTILSNRSNVIILMAMGYTIHGIDRNGIDRNGIDRNVMLFSVNFNCFSFSQLLLFKI